MCVEPSPIGEVFWDLVRAVPVYAIVGGMLIALLLNIPLSFFERRQNKQRRSRALDVYRREVYRLQQAAAEERDIAAAALLDDVYRLTRKR